MLINKLQYQGYVEWKCRRVDIPRLGYNAGGIHKDYTPDKVLSTLEFLYNNLRKKNLLEVKEEMLEEMHSPRLLEIAAQIAVDDDSDELYEFAQPLFKRFNIKVIKRP